MQIALVLFGFQICLPPSKYNFTVPPDRTNIVQLLLFHFNKSAQRNTFQWANQWSNATPSVIEDLKVGERCQLPLVRTS